MKRRLLFLFLVLQPVMLFSQAANFGAWYSYLGTFDLTNRVDIQANSQFRFFNKIGDWDQYLLRTGVNYKLDHGGNYIGGLGFDYFYNEPYVGKSDTKTHFNEYRIYEQLITRQAAGRFSFMHRYRLENRFRAGRNMFLRFRYFLQTRLALNKKTIKPGTFYLSVINETFWNFKAPNYFDRYWLQTSLGYVINNKWTIEVGNQSQFLGNGISNNRLQFWVFHHLKLKQSKTF